MLKVFPLGCERNVVVVGLWLFGLLGGIGGPIRNPFKFWAAVYGLAICVITVGLLQRDTLTNTKSSLWAESSSLSLDRGGLERRPAMAGARPR